MAHQLGAVSCIAGPGTTSRLSSCFWGATFAASSTATLNGAGTRCPAKHQLFIVARRKSGFAELFLNKRSGQQEQQEQMVGGRPRLKRGQVSPRLAVPKHIMKPPYLQSSRAPAMSSKTQVQDAVGIAGMRAAGKLAARVLEYAGTLVKPGVTTDEIDKGVHQMIIENDAYPSPLGYGGFPKSVCTSVNECICHGIPDSRPLLDGDIINIDVTVYLNPLIVLPESIAQTDVMAELVQGYHGDTSKTFYCGTVSDEAKQLVEVTRECLDKAIAVCGPGVEFKLIGNTIQSIADKYRYGVVEHFVGHGVGQLFHSAPAILHYRNNDPGTMVLGQTFTIEPMLTMGSVADRMWDDNWTVVTEDGSLAAQFEHSLLITEDGVEILTVC